MQTLSQIRELLQSAGREPNKRFGQNFLIDGNLMAKLLELAEVKGDQTVLEIGSATGSLTEELLARAARVVAVEIDSALARLLSQRLGQHPNLVIVNRDALASKHELAPEILAALAPAQEAVLVSNLPYNVAVPLLINCLKASWQRICRPAGAMAPNAAVAGVGEGEPGRELRDRATPSVLFRRLSFTVQRELAKRLIARAGQDAYGPVSVIISLLASATAGRLLPPEAFWPRPQVQSQMLRLDFDESLARQVRDMAMLSAVLAATFGHRRKKIATAVRHGECPFSVDAFLAALSAARISPDLRAEQVEPEAFRAIANALATTRGERLE